jgi:hypothetical protein
MPSYQDNIEEVSPVTEELSEAKILGDMLFSKETIGSAGSDHFLRYYVGGVEGPEPALIEGGYPVNNLNSMAEVGRLITNHQFGWNGNEGGQMTNKEIAEKYPKQENLTTEEVLGRLDDVCELLEKFGMEGVKEKRIDLVKKLSDAIKLARSLEK